MAGAKTDAATAPSAWVSATRPKEDVNGSTRQPSVTIKAATATTARLLRTRSISAPAGAWATSPAIAATVITTPMLAGSQRCTASR